MTLEQYKNKYRLTIQQNIFIGLWLLKTLSLIHSLGLAHNDISISNMMVTYQGQLKLIDFGLSCITSKPTYYNTCTYNRLVNEKYISPELQNGLYGHNPDYFSKTSDVFSAGLVLYELLTNNRPYRQDQKGNIISGYNDIKKAPCLNLVLKKMLMIDPYKRSSAHEAYQNLLKCKQMI
jgi:serine/threonine protein kinase